MLALLEMDKSVKVRGGVAVFRERICGVHVLRIVIKADAETRPRRLEKLYARSLAEMLYHGADAFCFKDGFPGRAYFAASGYRELTARRLYEREAANITRLAARSGETAAVFSAHIMRHETETIRQLAADFRHVLLFTGTCPAALVRDMGERLGASLIREPSDSMLSGAAAAIFFDEPVREVEVPEKCVVISPSGEVPGNVRCSRYVSGVGLYAPAYIDEALPDGYPRDVLLSALVSACVPGSESIRAETVEVSHI